MQMQIVLGENLTESIENLLEKISPNEKSYIVVPDRETLQIEEMLFSTLNLKSTFNISVVGLSNLALSFIPKPAKSLGEIESVLFVKKAMSIAKEKLCYFKSTNINFCKEIYKFISQLKSSSIKPEQIVPSSNKAALVKKFEDIKIIYQEYEKLTSEFDDSSEIVDKFVNEIETQNLFADTKFYFAGFESFTSKHYLLLKALCKHAKSVCVAIACCAPRPNSYIYETDALEKIKKIAIETGSSVEVISPPSKLKGEAKEICNQLFAPSKKVVSGERVNIFEWKNKRLEAEFVAKMIAFEVFNGARYFDFVVAATDLEGYEDALRLAFEKNKIPYYFDTSESASKSYCALFFKKLLHLKYFSFRKDDVLFFLTSPFFYVPQNEIENVMTNFEGGGKQFFAISGIDQLKALVKAIGDDLFEGIEKSISFLENNLEKLQNLNLDEKTLAIEVQVPQILREIVQACKNAGLDSTFSEVISAIEIGLETKKVSAIPSYYDQVYIGDASDSFFGKVKNLFIVGANAGLMPKVVLDNSIFSDEELENAGFENKIEPTVKMINRRTRFKLFSLLSSWTGRLYLSYSNVGDDDKPIARSMVTNEIIEMFAKQDKIIKNLIPEDLKQTPQLLLSLGRSLSGAEEVLCETSNEQIKGFLSKALSFSASKFSRPNILNSAKQIGIGSSIKPTEAEKFFDCPFKVFCENVLKLTEKRQQTVSPMEIGSIVHSVVEDYGKKFNFKKLDDKSLEKFVSDEIKKYWHFSCAEEEIERQKLKMDLKRICNVVYEENLRSKFQPWMLEKSVEGKIDDKQINGRVDRVDKCGDVFRIIDYKTGKIEKNLPKALSYGKKLQLFAYAKLIADETDLKCGGIYYFNAKGGYKPKDFSPLVGISTENAKDIYASDKYISDEELKSMFLQAESMMLQATDYMSQGKFVPCPDSESCKYCKYKAVCLYDSENGVRQLKEEE